MIEIPKLVVILLIGFLAWYAVRWLNRRPESPARRRTASPPRQRAIEDLVPCPKCGTYVASGAGCAKPGCPQPR